jgi:hypothetical protein
VWVNVFIIGEIFSNFDLAHMVSTCTGVFMEKIPQIHHILKEEQF